MFEFFFVMFFLRFVLFFFFFFFFFNDTATTEIYTLSLHDALPILPLAARLRPSSPRAFISCLVLSAGAPSARPCTLESRFMVSTVGRTSWCGGVRGADDFGQSAICPQARRRSPLRCSRKPHPRRTRRRIATRAPRAPHRSDTSDTDGELSCVPP